MISECLVFISNGNKKMPTMYFFFLHDIDSDSNDVHLHGYSIRGFRLVQAWFKMMSIILTGYLKNWHIGFYDHNRKLVIWQKGTSARTTLAISRMPEVAH